MLTDEYTTLSESEDSAMIVYFECDSSFSDSELSNAEPSNTHLYESVSKSKMSLCMEKAKIVDRIR